MRMLLVSLFYFGLPLWAAARSPLNAGLYEVAVQFAQFVAVQTVLCLLFLAGAVILDRCLSGQWVWQDTVLVYRHSRHTTEVNSYVPKSTSELLHEYWRSPEGQAAYIAWLAHK